MIYYYTYLFIIYYYIINCFIFNNLLTQTNVRHSISTVCMEILELIFSIKVSDIYRVVKLYPRVPLVIPINLSFLGHICNRKNIYRSFAKSETKENLVIYIPQYITNISSLSSIVGH